MLLVNLLCHLTQRENCAVPNKKLFQAVVCHMSLLKTLAITRNYQKDLSLSSYVQMVNGLKLMKLLLASKSIKGIMNGLTQVTSGYQKGPLVLC